MAKADASVMDTNFGLSNEVAEQLTHAIESGNKAQISKITSGLHAADAADFIESIDSEKRERLLETLKGDFDPEILAYLEPEVLEEVTEFLGTEKSADAIAELTQEEAAEIVGELDTEEQQEILNALPIEYREAVEATLSFTEGTVGRLMQKKFVSVPEYWNVGQVVDYLREFEDLPEDFHEVYIVDAKQRPIKAVLTSKVLRNKREVQISELATQCKHILAPEMDQEEAAYIFKQYYLTSTPVVNAEGRIIGFVNVEDIVEIIEEEAEEDFMLLGGVATKDLYYAITKTVKTRFPWLWISLITSFVSAFVISQFSGSISKLVTLAALMPVVAAVVGVAGIQTLTVMVRAIAKKQIKRRNTAKIIFKEMLVCFFSGAMLGTLGGLGVLALYGNYELAIIFGAAINGCFVIAGLVGALVPITLYKLKIDPAVSSSTFLIAVTDTTSFLIFLGLATIFLL